MGLCISGVELWKRCGQKERRLVRAPFVVLWWLVRLLSLLNNEPGDDDQGYYEDHFGILLSTIRCG